MPKPPSRFELSAPPEETRRSRRLQNNCHSYVNIEYICFHNAPDNPAACRPETARISNRLSTDVCRNREGPTAPVTDQKPISASIEDPEAQRQALPYGRASWRERVEQYWENP